MCQCASHTNPSASLWHHQACGGEGKVSLTQCHWKCVYFTCQCSVFLFKEGWRDGEATLHECLLLPCWPSVKLFQVPASDRFPTGLAFETSSLLIMRIASLVAVLVGGRFWTYFLTFFCGVRSFTFMDLGSPPGDMLLVRECFSLGGYVMDVKGWQGTCTTLADLPPQCKLVFGYHYSFKMFWQENIKMSTGSLWKEMCWGGQGPSRTVLL